MHSEPIKQKILVVDDEPDALELISFNLKAAGFEVITADGGEKALEKVVAERPRLILLDLMLPEIDGLDVCKAIRRDPSTASIPIIMLTARTAEIDRVLGFEFGADDYVTKPFSPRELVLRVKSLLKRTQPAGVENPRLKAGLLEIDLPRHVASISGKPLELTATEFKLLVLLVQRRGLVQSREQLLRDVWDYEAMIDTRTVDTHVRRLREKLGDAAKYLDTVRGVGYRFVEEA